MLASQSCERGRSAWRPPVPACRVFTAAAEPGSPPRPESAPVLRPFTVQDTIRLATVSARRRKADDTSMIVNVDAMSERTDPDLVVNGIAATDTDPAGATSEAKSASGTSATAADDGAAEPADSSEAAAADAADADAPAAGEKSEQPSGEADGADAAKTDADAKTTPAADGAEGKKEDGDRLVVGAAHHGVSAPGREVSVVLCIVLCRVGPLGLHRRCVPTHGHLRGTSACDAIQALSTGGYWRDIVSSCFGTLGRVGRLLLLGLRAGRR